MNTAIFQRQSPKSGGILYFYEYTGSKLLKIHM